jgi:hypothetical protein
MATSVKARPLASVYRLNPLGKSHGNRGDRFRRQHPIAVRLDSNAGVESQRHGASRSERHRAECFGRIGSARMNSACIIQKVESREEAKTM